MGTLKKYNLQGEVIGDVPVPQALVETKANAQLVKDYIVAIRANARQWSASTLTRAEVAHTTKKAVRQKGTGGARHGSLVAPQYRGGGRAFGPRPKFDQKVLVNKKEKRLALRSLLAEKINANKVIIVDTLELEEVKTKPIHQFLKKLDCTKRALFLGEGEYLQLEIEGESLGEFSIPSCKFDALKLSIRNLQKVEFKPVKTVNGYDVLIAQQIIMTEPAFNELTQWLLSQEESHVVA